MQRIYACLSKFWSLKTNTIDKGQGEVWKQSPRFYFYFSET